MSKAKQGDTVKVHYTGSLEDGTVFDSSKERDPLEFTIGSGQVIPGFENMADGMEVGDVKKETIKADDAYGQRRDDLVMDVPKENLPEDVREKVKEGDKLQIPQENGMALVNVTSITDENITIDANPDLAGKDLTFEIELTEIVEK